MTRPFISRRTALVTLAAFGAWGAAGCGFKLRGAPDYTFKSIAVPGSTNIVRQLRRSLPVGGKVKVLPPEQKAQAEVVLVVSAENRSQLVVATGAAGQVRELQLRLSVTFKVEGQDGRERLAPTTLDQYREISFNETAALAKEGEVNLLYRDMENDIVAQILRRLAVVN